MFNFGKQYSFRNTNISTGNDVIQINGRTYKGSNVVMRGDQIIIDGVVQNDTELTGVTEIIVKGDIGSLTTDKSTTIYGNVKGNVEARGSVNCENVDGDVKASGSVNCDDVGGSVNAGGSVNCDKVKGNVTAGGSVWN